LHVIVSGQLVVCKYFALSSTSAYQHSDNKYNARKHKSCALCGPLGAPMQHAEVASNSLSERLALKAINSRTSPRIQNSKLPPRHLASSHSCVRFLTSCLRSSGFLQGVPLLKLPCILVRRSEVQSRTTKAPRWLQRGEKKPSVNT